MTILAIRCTTLLPAVLFACLLAMPTTAQEPAAGAVPDNVAPHPAPVQPLPFNHKTHLSSGPVCLTCHINPEPGTNMTFPATETCMLCHSTLANDKPTIKSLQEYSASGQPIPWVRVYAVTPGIRWSHKPHLDADTECETCHGDISQVESVSESKATVAMASCISCHQARGAQAECVTCHAWPTDQLLGIE